VEFKVTVLNRLPTFVNKYLDWSSVPSVFSKFPHSNLRLLYSSHSGVSL
jgi:hypothetical protein